MDANTIVMAIKVGTIIVMAIGIMILAFRKRTVFDDLDDIKAAKKDLEKYS